MGFFRLGKLDRGDKDREKDGAAAEASSAPALASASEPSKDRERSERSEKKKKPREGREGADSAAPSGAPGGDARSTGPARAQVGLSVNDFISKTKNQQRQGLKPSGPELIAYARYLGIDPVADHDLLWIAVEALEAPLPSDWTEHFDSNDRVFYYNATTRVSSWTHPLEHVYRDTYKTIVNLRNSNMSPAERGEKLFQLQNEVKQMHDDVNTEISQWTEHTDEQGNRFYFNRTERQSTWTDPRPAKCQILYLRQKMLHLLESNAGATAGFADNKGMGEGSRFGPLGGGGRGELEDPANKRSKVTGGATELAEMAPESQRRTPDCRSLGGSDAGSDSDSGEDRKAKKRKKKKKKKKEDRDGPSAPVRLGAPQKLGTSQSEPSVGCKPMLAGGLDEVRGANAGSSAAPSGMGRSPRTKKTHDEGAGPGAGHPALGGLAPLDESGLSLAGRSRVKAGIKLEPIGPGGEKAAPPGPPSGGDGAGRVRNSVSVPAL